MAMVAVWAIVIDFWLVGGATAVSASTGWAVGLVLFVALTRSSSPRLHAGVVSYAWLLLIAEFAIELARGVPA